MSKVKKSIYFRPVIGQVFHNSVMFSTLYGDGYSYGFNGMEKDDEWLGEAVVFKYRIHDPRLGRFLAVDPLHKEYPELTPYQFASNNPIGNLEVEGLEGAPVNPNTLGAPAPAGGNLQIPITNQTAATLSANAANPGVIINRVPIPKNCSTGTCTNSELNQRVVYNANFQNGDSQYSIGAYGIETAQLVTNQGGVINQVPGNPNQRTTQANDLVTANNAIANANAAIQNDQAAGNILPTATNGAAGTVANSYETTISIQIAPVNAGGLKLADAQVLQTNLQAANPNANVVINQVANTSVGNVPIPNGGLAVVVTVDTPSF